MAAFWPEVDLGVSRGAEFSVAALRRVEGFLLTPFAWRTWPFFLFLLNHRRVCAGNGDEMKQVRRSTLNAVAMISRGRHERWARERPRRALIGLRN